MSKSDKSDSMKDDAANPYKDTLFLPKTDFPMRAGLPQQEPVRLAKWEKEKLYEQLRKDARERNAKPFMLHDGPPYANGHIHIGTSMNKILKDLVVRTRQMTGFDADYIPGWDCHGLPIEWKVEEEYRAAGKQKRDVPMAEFRKACRDYAQKWIDIQRTEFKRLGGAGNWNDPYLTMAYSSEAATVKEFLKVAMSGQLKRGAQAGDVVAGRADGAGRGGDRVRGPQGDDDLGEVSGCRGRGLSTEHAGATAKLDGVVGRHLDDHALDDPGEPSVSFNPDDRVWTLRSARRLSKAWLRSLGQAAGEQD